jgi:membrane protease subunit (stomatin/prohibitin family)
MGKVSEEDFREMSTRLRARATRLIKQLDAGTGYRARIEADLAKRLGQSAEEARSVGQCAACATVNDADARFCKNCGQQLA